MKPRKAVVFVFFLTTAWMSAVASAQGVYVTRGENGPVFSDKPQAGAKEMTLKPLTVVPATPDPSPAAQRGGTTKSEKPDRRLQDAAPAYRSLSIISPENNGSVAGDTALLEVRLTVDPSLLLAEGHAFVVRVDGRFVDQRFTSTEFVVPPGFWPEGYLPANRSVQLEASIVDGLGQVVMRAAPVQFYSRQVIVRPAPYPPYPWVHPPQPPVRPTPIPGKPRRHVQQKEALEPPLKNKKD